jgi:hypothetical protein
MPRKKKVTIEHGGLGSDIKNVLESTGIAKVVEIFANGKDCGCDKRKDKLDKIFPERITARCLTEQEYNEWKEFREQRGFRMFKAPVEWEKVLYICKLYSDVFSKPYWKPDCPSCGLSTREMIKMIEMIDKVFETYEN